MKLISAGAIALVGLATSGAQAQDYPSRPIQAIIGFPAGSGADIMCRFFTTKVGELAKQQILVINKPGAFSSIAYQAGATAGPDGYSMLLTGNSIMAGGKFLVKDLPFDAKTAFVPATAFSATPFVVTAPGKAAYKTIPELITHLKAKPRNTYGSCS